MLGASVVRHHLTVGVAAMQLSQEQAVVVAVAHLPEADPSPPSNTRLRRRLLLDSLGWIS